MEPTVYSSYDYGGGMEIRLTSCERDTDRRSGINENRVANSKMNEMRLQGLFLRVSKDLLGGSLLGNGTNYTTSNLIHTAEIRNLETNGAFYFLRHTDATLVYAAITHSLIDD